MSTYASKNRMPFFFNLYCNPFNSVILKWHKFLLHHYSSKQVKPEELNLNMIVYRTWIKQDINVDVSSGSLSHINISSIVSEASLSGPIEAIYVIVGDTSDANKQILSRFLRELDLSSRRQCPLLKLVYM